MDFGLRIADSGVRRQEPAIRNPQFAMASAGFTLLEVLVATALMGIAVAALMSGLSGSLRNLSRAEAYEKAVLVGRAQLNRLLVEETLTPGQLAGQWDESVRWEAEIRPWDPSGAGGRGAAVTNLMVVSLTVFWKGARGEKHVTFETCKYEPQLPPQ